MKIQDEFDIIYKQMEEAFDDLDTVWGLVSQETFPDYVASSVKHQFNFAASQLLRFFVANRYMMMFSHPDLEAKFDWFLSQAQNAKTRHESGMQTLSAARFFEERVYTMRQFALCIIRMQVDGTHAYAFKEGPSVSVNEPIKQIVAVQQAEAIRALTDDEKWLLANGENITLPRIT